MTVFGIGSLELILILLILILVFGPERITEMGRWLGQAYRKLTGLTSEVNQQVMEVRRAMDAGLDTSSLTDSIREAASEVDSIQRDLNTTVSESAAELNTLQSDVASTIAETQEQIKGDITPPSDQPEPDDHALSEVTEEQIKGNIAPPSNGPEPHPQAPSEVTEDGKQRDDDA